MGHSFVSFGDALTADSSKSQLPPLDGAIFSLSRVSHSVVHSFEGIAVPELSVIFRRNYSVSVLFISYSLRLPVLPVTCKARSSHLEATHFLFCLPIEPGGMARLIIWQRR